MKTYRLYSTSACHLCEIAKALIASMPGAGVSFVVEELDISESDELFERYGVRIPVLQAPDGSELGWPFDNEALGEFLAN